MDPTSVDINTIASQPIFKATSFDLGATLNKIFSILHDILAFFFGVPGSPTARPFHIFLGIVCIIILFVIAYCSVRLLEIREREHEHLHHELIEYAEKYAKAPEAAIIVNERWNHVLTLLRSDNGNDWRVAIIEADLILEDLTKKIGLVGENLGDRLKSANREHFVTLDDAWEAHLVRNRIAHEGSKFELSQRETQRVLYLYEQVFHEFGEI